MKAPVQAQVGFAADERGSGIAYVRLGRKERAQVLRVPFGVKRLPALCGREVGYAALTAVSSALHARGVEAVAFAIDDAGLTGDLCERRDVPGALTLAYVRLRCALNRFRHFEIAACSTSDLAARARSELALHVAA